MAEWQKHWLLALTIILVFGLLLGAPFASPRAVFSAPPVQDYTIDLDYGDDLTLDRWCTCESSCQQPLTVQVNMPAGAELTVWVQEDSQGGCEWMVRLLQSGTEIGRAYAGPTASDWSDPIKAVISSGSAQVETSAVECPGPFNHYAYVRFKVSSPPSEPTIDTPTPTLPPEVIEVTPPAIDFWADRDSIFRGECTTLHWRVDNVQAVYYQDEGVPGYGDRQECPQETTTYELYVVIYQASEQLIDETKYVTVYVEEPPTPTYTPTSRPSTHTPTPRPPTYTPTPRLPTATPTPRSATPTPTPRPLYLVPPASPSPVSPPPLATPPWVLVVTHSRALNTELGAGAWSTIEDLLIERYGEDNIDVLDLSTTLTDRTIWQQVDQAIQGRAQTYTDLPNFILIIGGPEIVAFGEVGNAMWGWCAPSGSPCDFDFVFTDDPYGSFDGDDFPEIPTARLPDGGDLELYNVQFSLPGGRTVNNWGSAMVIANVERPYGSNFANLLNTSALWSAPLNLTDPTSHPPMVTGHSAYFILHGSGFTPYEWKGDDVTVSCPVVTPVPAGEPGLDSQCYYARYPLAWNTGWAQGAGTQGTIISGACYGAFIGLPRTLTSWPVPVEDSIALTYLRNGAEAFMGHTAVTYSYVFSAEIAWCLPWPLDDVCGTRQTVEDWPVDQGSQAIEWFAFSEIANGQHPLIAFHRAKAALANSLGPPDAYHTELKALHSFVYYGLPPAPTRIEF